MFSITQRESAGVIAQKEDLQIGVEKSGKEEYVQRFSLKLVSNSHESFWEGRQLAKNIYLQAWGTHSENVSDDYSHAIIVSDGGKVVGNLNIKRRTAANLLPSEKFFRPYHWVLQCNVDMENTAELCSFAVSESISSRDRLTVFRGLIFGAHLHAAREDIQLYVTVQRSELINTLVRLLRYPFFPSVVNDLNKDALPNDAYWKTDPKPQLYYGLTSEGSAYRASFKLLSTFLLTGLTLEQTEQSTVAVSSSSLSESDCHA